MTQFEFRLVGGDAPEGELIADDLIAIAQSLKEVATKLGRGETASQGVGRPTRRTLNIARLMIGLAPGSTRVLVQRAETDESALDFDLQEETAFDEKFQALIESIATDERPGWVTGTLAVAAGKLRTALENAAPTVEFKVGGELRTAFATAATRKETWLPVETESKGLRVDFVGRLRMVNLDSHRLQVTDDLGNKVVLLDAVDAPQAGRLLGEYVSVVGAPEHDASGRLSHIHNAVIEAAAPIAVSAGVREVVPLEQILAQAPGPAPGGISDLTDEEAESFLKAIGL